MSAPDNLIDQRFSRLVVLEKYAIRQKGKVIWICKCDCGSICNVSGPDMKSGNTKSCGCIRSERQTEIAKSGKLTTKKQEPHITTAKSIYKELYADGDLTFDDFIKLSQQNCFYCNSPPNRTRVNFVKKSSQYFIDNCGFKYNGLDAITPLTMGGKHTKENSVPCCMDCNQSKRELNIKDFISNIYNICNNHIDTKIYILNIPDVNNIDYLIDCDIKYFKNKKLCFTHLGASFMSIFRTGYKDANFSIQIFHYLSQQSCFYCGTAPTNQISYDCKIFKYNGLDRFDNTKGHTLNNVVPSCKYCNYAKRARSYEDFISWAFRVKYNLEQKDIQKYL